MSTVESQDLLQLLSEDESARVAHADTSWLNEGDEYVDLDAPKHGVQRARATSGRRRHRVLSRRAIRDPTWELIVARLHGDDDP
ncbi:MAG TPA: hypothetical protein VLM85_14770 [Polyangiaceae bacterium]|nr:hypothetical protein [Polyangiaceae bacterium]